MKYPCFPLDHVLVWKKELFKNIELQFIIQRMTDSINWFYEQVS